MNELSTKFLSYFLHFLLVMQDSRASAQEGATCSIWLSDNSWSVSGKTKFFLKTITFDKLSEVIDKWSVINC